MFFLKDLSYSGASFYTNDNFCTGMRLNLVISDSLKLSNTEIVRIDKNKSGDSDVGLNVVSVKFTSSENMDSLKSLIDSPQSEIIKFDKERRKYIRKECPLTLEVKKDFADRINVSEFKILSNAIVFKTRIAIPLFHEIQLEINTKSHDKLIVLSGMVINCEKGKDLYNIELFIYSHERHKINFISLN